MYAKSHVLRQAAFIVKSCFQNHDVSFWKYLLYPSHSWYCRLSRYYVCSNEFPKKPLEMPLRKQPSTLLALIVACELTNIISVTHLWSQSHRMGKVGRDHQWSQLLSTDWPHLGAVFWDQCISKRSHVITGIINTRTCTWKRSLATLC